MSSGSYATIGIPIKYVTAEIIARIEEHTNIHSGELVEPVICFSNSNASDGRFDELENDLIELGIPFDRHTTQDFDINASTRYFRPVRECEPAIDIETDETRDGEVVPVNELKKIVDLPPKMLVALLRKILEKHSPEASLLEDWNE
jgi:hypothetical protein